MPASIPNHKQAYLIRIAAQCNDEIPVCVHKCNVKTLKSWVDGVFCGTDRQGTPVLDILLVQFHQLLLLVCKIQRRVPCFQLARKVFFQRRHNDLK